MTAAALQLLWALAAAAAAAVWGLLAARLGVRDETIRSSRAPVGSPTSANRIEWLLVATAAGLLAARGALVAGLAAASVAFVSDRIWGLALTVAMTAAAVTALAGRSPSRSALAGGAAVAAGAELVLVFVVGAPVPVWAGVSVVVAVVAATAAGTIARLHRGRRPLAATIAAAAVAVLALAAVGAVGIAGPGALTDEGFHAHDRAAEERTPTTRTVSIESLVAVMPPGARVFPVRLDAQRTTAELASGATVEAWTFGELAGPALVAAEGDVLDLELTNRDIEGGATVHWHGYPVPAASDGVAGVTQDAVAPGDSFRTRFVLDRPGTYWYHTHQLGSEGVTRGLYGTLVVQPAGGQVDDVDVVLPLHTFGRTVVLGDDDEARHTRALEGQTVRARLVNTDQVPQRFTVSGTAFRVVAIDGADVETRELEGVAVELPAGGRYDVAFTMPRGSVAVRAEASRTAAMVFAPAPADPPSARSAPRVFDPITEVVGSVPPDPTVAGPLAAAAESGGFDVDETYVLDRLPRLLHGMPQYAYTVNGAAYPHIPSTVVSEGDTVRLTVVNRGSETHPMHPHGHTVRVLSVDGVPPAAPLWLDTFDVGPGEVWKVAFVADNPGIWMDHCHNLEHATLGMVLHIAYDGVSTPFENGGHAGNAPE